MVLDLLHRCRHGSAVVQEVTLTQVPWSSVAAGLPSMAALSHLRKLSLLDNNLQHLHQASTAGLRPASCTCMF